LIFPLPISMLLRALVEYVYYACPLSLYTAMAHTRAFNYDHCYAMALL
jgi:hypothetical protein